jgi:hypothetical protein
MAPTKDKCARVANRPAAASPGVATNNQASARSIVGEPVATVLGLSGTQQISTQPAKRRSFSVQPVDLFADRRCQRRGSGVPPEPAEYVLEMQVSLG